MDFEIIRVNTKSDKKRFIKSQWNFYRGDKNWVPPIIADRQKLLDTEKNPFFKHSDIELFMAIREGGVIGRIAAIRNGNHNETHNDKLGFFGFFECVNEQPVADALFKTAENWLKERGLDSIRGPVHPSMNDENAFLLEGDGPPRILMSYNPMYYHKLCQNYGFEKARDLYAYSVTFEQMNTPKMQRLQGLVRERYDITVKNVDFKNKEQFKKDVADLKYIYNHAWEPNWGFVKMTDEEFDFLVADFKQIADPKLAFILYVKGKPAGFHLALPDINQALIYNRGGSLLGAVWQLLAKKKKINIMRIIVLGLLKEYQGKGIDSVLYYESGLRGNEFGVDFAEASWILEDNDMMNRGLTQTMNAELYRKYRIYEKAIY